MALLCEQHAASLEEFLDAHEVSQEGARISGVRETAEYYEYFATMDEVERDKQRYLDSKKAPPARKQ